MGTPRTATLGILLAGGKGRRLDLGAPKALARLGAFTLLERGLATLDQVTDEVVVAAPRAIDLPLERGTRVHDAGEGPLAALIESFSGRSFDRAVVLGVDFPLVRAEGLEAMLALLTDEWPAVIPAPAGRLQPLVAVYRSSGAEGLATAFRKGERSVTAAAGRLGPRVLDDDELDMLEGGRESFLNLNHPADLEEAERLLRERAGRA